MSNLVRGGQITFHSLRMLAQLIKPLSKWGFITWVLLTISISHSRLLPWEINYTFAYLKANLYTYIKAQEEPVSVGKSKIKSKYVVENSAIKRAANKAYDTLRFSGCISLGIVGFFWILAVYYFSRKGFNLKKSNIVRGREIITPKELNSLILKYNRTRKYKSYLLAGISYSAYGEMQHTMISGSSGTGKTILFYQLIEQIIANGDKAIIYDMAGTFTERFYNPAKDILLNPFDARASNWSLLEEASHEIEFDTIAEALVGNGKEYNNPFWQNGAKTIMSELCKLSFREGNLSTQAVLDRLFNLDLKRLHSLLKGTPANNLTLPSNEETTMGLLATLTTYVSCLKYVKEGENNFSIKKWITDDSQKGCLYLTSRPNFHSSVAPLIAAMMDIAVSSLMTVKRDPKRKVWFIFDELASLNALPSLERGLTVTRNFGGCFLIGIQSISQLYEQYGRHKANTISSNCGNKVILKANDAETARWCVESLGSQEVELVNEGLSYGVSDVRDGVNISRNSREKDLVLASEIMALPNLEGYILMTGGFPISRIKYDYKDWPSKNKAFIANYGKEDDTRGQCKEEVFI